MPKAKDKLDTVVPEPKAEWITTLELAKRLDTSTPAIGMERKKGNMTARYDKKQRLSWPWPKAKQEWDVIQSKKRKKIGSHGKDRPKFDFNAAEHSGKTDSEKVLEAIALGAKNAPDIAYMYSKALEQHIKTRIAMVKLQGMEDKTLTRSEVESMAFTQGRNHRDHWMNWPEIVALKMGEELEIDAKLCHDVLKKYVRIELERIAKMPLTSDRDISRDVSKGGSASTKSDD